MAADKHDHEVFAFEARNESLGHELFRATYHRRAFNLLRLQLNERSSRDLKLMCYEAYSAFVQSLFEFYVKFIQRDEALGRIPKGAPRSHHLNDAVQRALNFSRHELERSHPNLPNHVPPSFGETFIIVRNIITHADGRRMSGSNACTLASFYKQYDLYAVLLLETPQLSWGGNDRYEWRAIDDFTCAVLPTS